MKTKISLFTLILLLAAFGGLSAAEPADAAGELIVIEDDGKTQEVDLSQAKQPALVKAEPMLVSSYMDPTKYTLGPDDVIEIAVQRHPEFSGTYPVNLEGKIQYKFVGDLEVSGMTKTELEKKITEIISAYVINPEINVTILEYKSKVVYILGEVGAPGKYFMRSETIPVREAVVNAGLPQLTAAMRRCLLITPDRTGKAKTRTVDLYGLLYGGDLSKNVEMKPGDVLYVPATVMAKVIRVINPVTSAIGVSTSGPSNLESGRTAVNALVK